MNDRRLGIPTAETDANVKAMTAIAEAHGIKIILLPATDKTFDGIHPTEEGYAELARYVISKIGATN